MLPVPQLDVHAPHICHALTEQSTGQVKSLQLASCAVIGQGVPPPFAVCKITRMRDQEPPSQDRVHVVQDAHAVTSQLLDGLGVVGMNDGLGVGDSVGAAVGGSYVKSTSAVPTRELRSTVSSLL